MARGMLNAGCRSRRRGDDAAPGGGCGPRGLPGQSGSAASGDRLKEAGMLAIVMEAWRWIRQTWLWRFRPRHGNVFIENGIWIVCTQLESRPR